MSTISVEAILRNLESDLERVLHKEELQTQASPQDWTFSPRQAASVNLWRSLTKKFVDDRLDIADNAAYDVFRENLERVSRWNLVLENEREEILWGELKRFMYNFFHPQGDLFIDALSDLYDVSRVGPGASQLSPGTSIYSKLYGASSLSGSELAHLLWESYVTQDVRSLEAEISRLLNADKPAYVESRVGKLNFAPKNRDVSRPIITPPALNIFFQLGLGVLIENRLRSVSGISLSTQQIFNRELALRGSRDDSYVTIDLSSASDSFSLKLAELLIPPDIFWLFKGLREEFIDMGHRDDVLVEAPFISAMGNGFTFALQTALFTGAVFAAAEVNNFPLERPRCSFTGNYAVFGDDIIIPKPLEADVLTLLRLCGFVVNREKSFFSGHFRESCGVDAYQGVDIRGVYFKKPSEATVFSTINRLLLWSAKWEIPLVKTVNYFLGLLNEMQCGVLYVPPWESESAGIRVPQFALLSRGLLRRDVNRSLIYKRLVPRSASLLFCRSDRIGPDGETREGPISLKRGNGKEILLNQPGLWNSFLHGSLTSVARPASSFSPIPLRANHKAPSRKKKSWMWRAGERQNSPSFKVQRAVAPNWDISSGWVGASLPYLEVGVSRQKWETFVCLNLSIDELE